MHIILDNYGVELSQKNHMFTIEQGAEMRSISPAKVTAIHVYKPARLSSAALLLAAENNIPVLLYDAQYKPAVRIWKSNFSSSGQVRVQQPLFCNSSEGQQQSRQIVCLKMEGQLHNLKYFASRSATAREQLLAAAQRIQAIYIRVKQVAEPMTPDVLRGYEGATTAAYWQALAALLDNTVFTKRLQRDAQEPFNSCLNYLYGILYGKTEGALLAYGLDPMVGLLHSEGYSKKSLVYDCIEPFRHWAEWLLVRLFKNKSIDSSHFKYTEEKMQLEKEGRRLLSTAFLAFLSEKTLMHGRRITRNDQLTAFASSLAQTIKNHKNEKQ